MPSSSTMYDAHTQWAHRPADERFESLDALRVHLQARRSLSSERLTSAWHMAVQHTDDGAIVLQLQDDGTVVFPNYRAFGQLCTRVGAPASYLRTLPAPLAATNIDWGLQDAPRGASDVIKLLITLRRDTEADTVRRELRAVTSQTYGRIWDDELVAMVDRINHGGNWQVPAATYAATNPKRATTLYAGDSGSFVFLVDPDQAITIGTTANGDPDVFFRGFILANSEVGDAAFSLKTFLYRKVCDNRIIWGVRDIAHLNIRHTAGGPVRFARDAHAALARFAGQSGDAEIAAISAAKAAVIDDVAAAAVRERTAAAAAWLAKRSGLPLRTADKAIAYAMAEEGKAQTVFDVVQGLTAYARSEVVNTDNRLDIEVLAGKLLASTR